LISIFLVKKKTKNNALYYAKEPLIWGSEKSSLAPKVIEDKKNYERR